MGDFHHVAVVNGKPDRLRHLSRTVGGGISIGADRAVNYNSDSEGTQLNYEVLSNAISAVRSSTPLSADWKNRIEEDYEKRGKDFI